MDAYLLKVTPRIEHFLLFEYTLKCKTAFAHDPGLRWQIRFGKKHIKSLHAATSSDMVIPLYIKAISSFPTSL